MVKLSDFSKTCRLCSKVYRVEKLVKIFSSRGISLNLKDSVNSHLPIKVVENDTTMPKNICINCIRRLNTTNEFFGTVIASDKLFKKLLRKEEERNSKRLGKQKQSDSIPIRKINEKSNDLSPSKDNATKESYDQKKSDSDPCLDSHEYKTILPTEVCEDNSEKREKVLCHTRNNRALENLNQSRNDNIQKGKADCHLKDTSIRSRIETGGLLEIENQLLSNNSIEQLDKNDAKYVNIVPKASHVVLSNRNCNGNIIINVGSKAGKDSHHIKLPIEVLCCPDCNETVKIYSSEERQLFFEYLKQHSCKKSNTDCDKEVKSFIKYKETYESENIIIREKVKDKYSESNQIAKSHASGKQWPDGDLPADPGPDPTICENIFEDDVRLDDDFHWPMPKRIRRLHRCASCEFVTKSALRLKTHQKLHRTTSDKRQTLHSTSCKHCHKRFETINEAKKHERLAHVTFNGKNSLCEYCGIMKPQKTLRDHVLKQHTMESEIEMQECDVCGKSFISPTSLYLHKKIHTIEKQHLCDLCGKAFKQRIAMRRHYMLHFPRAPPKFKCNICEKRVTTRGSLRLHMMRHTGEKPQECPECHMVMRHGLKHHMRLHSDEAPFKCVVCGADFKRRDYVRRHMRKHLNEREHRSLHCNICDHMFDDIKNFLIHHQNIHSNEIFTQIKIYQCKICSMQFADGLLHKDHEDICTIRERDEPPPRETCVNEVESGITIGNNKLCVIDDRKNCPKHVTASNHSHSCVYCDYKETNDKISVVEHKERGNTAGNLLANALMGEEKFPNQNNSANNRLEESRFRFNEELNRLKKIHEHDNSSNNVIFSENDVMSLGTESSEYSYMNIIDKSNNLRDKDNIMMSVDEQIITNSSVHVFSESPVAEQFSNQSLHSHPLQAQIEIHPHTETYTRESLSWKQL